MIDVQTQVRQAWLRELQRTVPLCYLRNPDGSYAWRYTPVAEQGATYLADKFRAMRLAA